MSVKYFIFKFDFFFSKRNFYCKLTHTFSAAASVAVALTVVITVVVVSLVVVVVVCCSVAMAVVVVVAAVLLCCIVLRIVRTNNFEYLTNLVVGLNFSGFLRFVLKDTSFGLLSI